MTRRNNKKTDMARNNKRKQNGHRRSSNRSRAVLPPAKTIMGHIMRTIVQTAWDIAQGALRTPDGPLTISENPTQFTMEKIDNGWILAQGWLDRFKGLFKEVKVHKITAHYMPYDSPTNPGEYAFVLCDYGEDKMPSSFSECVGAPASVIRKSGRPARLVWYPTEPDDRNWHDLADTHNWCSFALYQSEPKYVVDIPGSDPKGFISGVEGKIIIDLDASFRGKPSKPTPGVFADRDAPSDSAAFKEYQRQHPCLCRKCLRKIMHHYMTSISGSSSPFTTMDVTGRFASVDLQSK